MRYHHLHSRLLCHPLELNKLKGPKTLQKHREVTELRIQQFIKRLEQHVYRESVPLSLAFCGQPYGSQAQAKKGKFKSIKPGFAWGPVWSTSWFRIAGQIPQSWKGKRVVARLDLGSEATIWENDSPVLGVDKFHLYAPISEVCKGEERVKLWVQAYGGESPGVKEHGETTAPPPRPYEVKEALLQTMDHDLWQFFLDFRFSFDLLSVLPKTDVAREHLLRGLNEAINVVDFDNNKTLNIAHELLRSRMAQKRVDKYHTLYPVGHAHLDTAWLWPLSITSKKLAHTVANQLALIEKYPEYIFVHSQPAQYEMLQKEYPVLFDRVAKNIAKGRWEPVGGMWVEADCNISGGESLVRQLLHGKRFFAKNFGVDVKEVWVPDIFGFSGALPQILVKAGIDYVMTQKMSWNQSNRLPHHTFWWKGIDGSQVWTHFPPADTYNAECTPFYLYKHLTDYTDHARCDYGLFVFGYGDGGGGPTAEHLELLRRAEKAPGFPQIKRQKAREFFAEAKKQSKDLATWTGELYLECHRGVYTTQARTKLLNRRCEFLLRDLEFLCCADPSFPKKYPVRDIEKLWKIVLLNQFHDVLPGSSVTRVYEQTEKQYSQVISRAKELSKQAVLHIAQEMDTAKTEKPVAMFCLAKTSSEGHSVLSGKKVPSSLNCAGQTFPVQCVEQFGKRELIFEIPKQALGTVALADFRSAKTKPRTKLQANSRLLRNDKWEVRFDKNGNIESFISLADGKEFVQQGAVANLFQLFDDNPTNFSAWNIDPFVYETTKDLLASEKVELVEKGPVRVAIQVEKRFGSSRILQRISLGPTPGLRFDTQVDWHENNKMLKVAFPVNVNANRAAFEIQFGTLERPTHSNTSWDMAQFEVCAHKWVDLCEGEQGVALLNDCKYGHDVKENVIRLTLLRSPKAPDPVADMGTHRFTYALLPHGGVCDRKQVVNAAYALNAPLHCYELAGKRVGSVRGKKTQDPFVICDNDNLEIAAVKKAEDSNDLIIRLYEAYNSRGNTKLTLSKGIKKAFLCDLLENDIRPLKTTTNSVHFEYKPFEIITIKVCGN
ncbi:MAG: alpha-mannosidase [Pseudomonadota bacterium]